MEVVQCDECGFTQAVESERFAENEGWKFAPSAFEVNDGTKCPACVINQLKAEVDRLDLENSDEISMLKMQVQGLDDDLSDLRSQYNELVSKCETADRELRDLAWDKQIGREITAGHIESIASAFSALKALL
jgi:conjugal transfer/entry exclusion protein